MKQKLFARGFSLIELLTTIAVIVVLTAIGFAGYSKYIDSAKRGKEAHAGRALIAGFHAYAADNGGRILKAMDPNPGKVVDNQNKPVMVHAARRYPWRLAPYIDYNVDSIIMVNNTKAAPKNSPMYSYLVTVFPTFGMNGVFVGGKYGTSMSPDHPRALERLGNFCVTNITQPHKPSQLIVFASAKMYGAPHTGCFDISGPGIGAVGEIDFKYNNRAVVCYFDGHIELNTVEDLKDMRRWSNQAATQDNPNWMW
jgi:prepilin-type N-terminal cleavage/methylation domain-containing protein/prepilin-type processing-associated H-X9-DG protein